MKNHSILITGSEGLIGKELFRKLEEREINVVGYDIKKGENILDQKSLEKIISDIDGVIHLAAVSRVVAGYKDPYKAILTNIIGTANLLELIRTKNPSCWMIFGSSREVYGESYGLVKETDPHKPVNVYGASKSAGEYLCLCYGNNYNLRTFVVRFSNVYGGLNDHPDRVVPQFFIQALTNSDITVYGGKQTFDFVHLSDAVDGLIKLIQKIFNGKKLKTRTFHFVTGKGANLLELSNKIIKLTNSKSHVKYLPRREFDVDTFVGDPSVTMNILGWKPKVSIDEGLESYLKLIKG
jgi:nucleoside-diphosphate-sugar epimerase